MIDGDVDIQVAECSQIEEVKTELENPSFRKGPDVSSDDILGRYACVRWIERTEVGDLRINLQSGELTAAGPGWMTSVRRGSANPLRAGDAGRTPAAPTGQDAPAGRDDSRLEYLRVRYRGSITGNVHQRQMTFHDQVRTTYGPVDTWDSTLETDDPDYFVTPAPGLQHGSRFTQAALEKWLTGAGWEILDQAHNELPGNKLARDRGSCYFLCQPTSRQTLN